MEIAQLIAGRNPSDIVTCEAGQPVREAVAILAEKRIGALPVMEDGRIAGIFSERDVIYRMADEGTACLEKLVGQVMTAPAITVEKSSKVDEALSLMTKRRIRHLPVTDNGAFAGFVSIGDLVKSRIDEVEHEAAAMRDYIQTA
ncbi:CBS domain-containing protein [Parerythrobacter jejuensis]|uniref:CBS domain-containing protein n=1 Tax=Parerythrobacter jejuensis TaxID=795812 RepID=A0A845AQ09_9SPHN|nr:CBS domain-containing protein [Parerythrobacter jejuensis]MXP30961.1 CBS domain-containing protein [Parerythrobacter jejuensis]MXP33721.1 CBS domain-containing protein [Parerythrobacter jejuensis]